MLILLYGHFLRLCIRRRCTDGCVFPPPSTFTREDKRPPLWIMSCHSHPVYCLLMHRALGTLMGLMCFIAHHGTGERHHEWYNISDTCLKQQDSQFCFCFSGPLGKNTLSWFILLAPDSMYYCIIVITIDASRCYFNVPPGTGCS